MQETNQPSPSVDFELLNSIFDGDPVQVREVLDLYVEQSGLQIQNMAVAISSNATGDLNHLAHKCAGASASCGMTKIVPMLRNLERMGKENQMTEAPQAYELVKTEFAAIQQCLAKHFAGK